MSLTRKEKARYSAIIRELSDLSRNGWEKATYDDYTPLERELRALEMKKHRGKS